MPCFLVLGGGIRIPINFHQHKARRVILLLADIEARDARLFQALARIGECRLFKSLNALRPDVNMNMNNKHVRRICESGEKLKHRDGKNQSPGL